MTTNNDDIINSTSESTVLELNELVEEIKNKFGADVAAPGTSASVSAANEKQSGCSVSLDSIGANRVALLKAVLELTGLSLKEAKDLVDGVPSIVKEGLPQDQAEEVKNRWRKQGVRHHSNKAVPGDVFKVVCTSP